MNTSTYQVTGMNCGHCVGAVSDEVGQLSGVTKVEVDLPTGQVTVTSNAPLEVDAVQAAVKEAGYEVVV